MRVSKLLFWMLLCGVFAFASASATAQTPARTPGRIIAAKVQGTVTAVNQADHSQRTLANNDSVTQNYVINTGANSSVILVFSNGATLNVGADSSLSIDEFLQDPFDKDLAVGDMKEEPSTSTTKVNLVRGELVGNVKHLHQDQGSSFTVNTPVGAAGIRGTTFRIVFKPDANGKVFFTISTADGVVLYKAPAGKEVQVPSGKEVAVTADVKVDANGKITFTTTPTVESHDVSSATKTAIEQAAQEAVETAASVIVQSTKTTTTTSSTTTPTTDTKEQKDQTKDSQKDQQQQDTNTVPNSPTPRTTSGEGGS